MSNMLRLFVRRNPLQLRQFCTDVVRRYGAVGLTRDPDPRKTLLELYKRTLAELNTIPPSAIYRVNVEKTTKYRMGVVESVEDVAELETRLGLGLIEEIIEQANDELDLIPHMSQWKPWEMPEGQHPVRIELID